MSYITKDEFELLSGTKAPENIEYLIDVASSVLDAETRYFYVTHKLDEDIQVRSRQFKRALVYQIQFFIDNNTSSVETLNAKPNSVTIGDTTVSYNRTVGASESSNRATSLSVDAKNILASIGLLYRGALNDV